MKLTSVFLENFKCFQKPVNIDFGRLTLLTGANSSGKSSILYSVLAPLQSEGFPFQFSTNGKYVNMGDFRELAYQHEAEAVSIRFVFANGVTHDVETTWMKDPKTQQPQLSRLVAKSSYFQLTITQSDGYVLNFEYDADKDQLGKLLPSMNLPQLLAWFESSFRQISPSALQELQLQEQATEPSQDQHVNARQVLENVFRQSSIRNRRFARLEELMRFLNESGGLRLKMISDEMMRSFVQFDEKVNYISSFRLHPERTYLERSKSELKVEKFGEGYLDQIIHWQTRQPEKFQQLIDWMQKMSLLHHLSTKRMDGGRYEMRVQTKEEGPLSSLSDVGFGVSQFLPIMVADLQLPDDSTLLVAQPEIHLHPSVQSLYGSYLVEQINGSDKNYVVETHSEYLLNRIRLAIVKGELKEEDLSVYFLDNQGDTVTIHTVRFAKNGQILNAPANFFTTYMMDVMEIAINAEA